MPLSSHTEQVNVIHLMTTEVYWALPCSFKLWRTKRNREGQLKREASFKKKKKKDQKAGTERNRREVWKERSWTVQGWMKQEKGVRPTKSHYIQNLGRNPKRQMSLKPIDSMCSTHITFINSVNPRTICGVDQKIPTWLMNHMNVIIITCKTICGFA